MGAPAAPAQQPDAANSTTKEGSTLKMKTFDLGWDGSFAEKASVRPYRLI